MLPAVAMVVTNLSPAEAVIMPSVLLVLRSSFNQDCCAWSLIVKSDVSHYNYLLRAVISP